MDAFNSALGGYINQIGSNSKLYLIAYYFRKFITTKLNYNIYNKELLAIIDTIEQFRLYLEKSKNLV